MSRTTKTSSLRDRILDPSGPARPVCRPVLLRATAILRQGSVPRDALGELLLADPVLASEVILLARSDVQPFSGRVDSVAAALEILGRTRLLDALEELATLRAEPRDRRRYLAHLRHAIVTSLCAEGLAELLGEVPAPEARLVGLTGPRWPRLYEDDPAPAARDDAVLERLELARALPLHQAGGASSLTAWQCILDLAAGMAPRFGAPPAGPARFGSDEGTLIALHEAAAAVQDRVERHVQDGLLVLGTLLGIPELRAETLIQSFEDSWECVQRNAWLDRSVVPALRMALDRMRQSRTEHQALLAAREALLDLPQARAVVVGLDASGLRLFPPGTPRPELVDLDAIPQARERQAGRNKDTAALRQSLGAGEVVVVPIRFADRPVGEVVLAIEGSADPALPAAVETLVRAMERQIESIQHETTPCLAQDRMRRDQLTGVLSRAAVMERLAAETHRVHRHRSSLAVMMIDVDHFKDWNDLNGHQAGDRVLAEIGQLLQGAIRESDVVGRYGGDEFLVLLPGRGAEDAEKVRARIHERESALADELAKAFAAPRLGLSIGIAAVSEGPIDAATLLFRADHALYRVKEARRRD